MFMHLLGSTINAAEMGRIPDIAIRFGIRNLLKERERSLKVGDLAERDQRLRAFIDECRQSPIALVPDLANEQHYEVPSEFFARVLGHRLKYSSCYWPENVTALDQAEDCALSTTCLRAGIEDDMEILELGCGWGSLTLWMAEHYPRARITAVSNSATQREFIEQQASRCSLQNVTVVTADMNDFTTDQTFDRVVSVEMFEHLRNHEEILRRISGWLRPTGRLFVHIFCHRDQPYFFETKDWMGRHFFTGGMMPSDDLLPRYQRDLSLVDHWRWDGRHYERTCNAWLKKLDEQQQPLLELFEVEQEKSEAVRSLNRWRIFFMACAELFGYRNGQEWWVSHYLFEKNQ